MSLGRLPLAALVLGSLAVAAPASAQTAYVLSCRGGPSMTIRTHADDDAMNTYIRIFFTRGAHAASQQLPAPGECSWLDRAMNDDEATSMYAVFRGAMVWVDVRGDGRLTGYDYSGSGPGAIAPLRTLIQAVLEGQPFTVHVVSQRGGEGPILHIRRVGP